MAQVTKSFVENSGSNRATWSFIANGTNVTASGATFNLQVPTIQAKYAYAAGDYKDTAKANIIDAILEVGSNINNRVNYDSTAQSWKRGVTKTLSRNKTSISINTDSIFTSNNKTSKTVDVYLNSNASLEYGMIDAESYRGHDFGYNGALWTSCGRWGPLATVTLNAPPTLSASNISSDTDGNYYKNITTAYTTISNLSAKYGGTISEVKLTIGSQSTTRTSNGPLSIKLNATGTFTPVVTVKDSRGQTNSYSLSPITVISAPDTTFSVSPLSADMDDYYAEMTTVTTTVSDIYTYTGITVSEIKLTIGNQTDTRTTEGDLSIKLNGAGTFTPVVTVKDSLNRVYTYPLDPITVKTYSVPNIVFNAERTTINGGPNDEGTSAVLTATISWTNLLADLSAPQVLLINESGEYVTGSVISWYKTRAANGSLSDRITNWDEIVPSDMPVYCLITSSTQGEDLFDTQKSYTIRVTPVDTIDSGTFVDRVLGSAFYTVDFLAGGHGIAFGKAAEQEGFECDMDASFNKKVFFKGKELAPVALSGDYDDLINKPSIADYVIEEGTSGGWEYRKWNSGILEQWRATNPGGYTCNQARGSLYSGGTITYTYPIEFTDYPVVTVNATLGTQAYVVWAQASGYTKTSIDVRIISSGSMSQNQYFMIHIHAIGRWK